MAKAYPKEFRDDVVAVARKGQAPLNQIAKDFGISEGTLSNWMKRADVEDGHRPGVTEDGAQAATCRAAGGSGCSSRGRTRSCDALPRICRRRTCRDILFPPSERCGDRCPHQGAGRGGVQGAGSRPGVLQVAQRPVSEGRDDAHVIDVIRDIHEDDATRYRFIADELSMSASSVREPWGRPRECRGLRLPPPSSGKSGKPSALSRRPPRDRYDKGR